MTLRVNGIEVLCIIGERADERTRLQQLRVDVVLTLPAEVADGDRLTDTVDYAALADRVRDALAEAKCQMVEHAAKVAFDACAAACADVPGAAPASVTVVKAGAVQGLESAAVSYP